MKILFIKKHLQKGGITKVLLNRLNFLITIPSFEIHILTEFENDPEVLKEFDSRIIIHNLNLQNLSFKKVLPIYDYFAFRRNIRKLYEEIINNLNPDIITDFDWGFYRDIIPTINCRGIKIKELHGSYMGRPLLTTKRRLFEKFLDRRIEKNHNKYDLVITLTKEDEEDRKYLSTRKMYIYNSISDQKNKSDFGNRKNVCISIGTLTPNKNFKDLILAISKIKDKIKNWEIHIYGKGADDANLQRLINNLSLQNIVFLKGFSDNITSVFNNAKLLVSTSLSEGLPMNLLEALSFNIPVIAYDFKCGAKEIIGQNNGSLVSLGDINVLSKEILKYISNEKLLSDISNHIDISHFESEMIMNQWIYLYNSLTNEN